MTDNTFKRRHVLGGLGGLIAGSVVAGTAGGAEHGGDGTDAFEGTIDGGNERDSYQFEASAGDGIELRLTAEDLESGRDLRMTLLDLDGREIGELPTDNPNRGAYVTSAELGIASVVGGDVAERTGTYCVRVSGADGPVDGPTEYTLSIETVRLDRFDPNEQRESATRLGFDETVEAVVAGYDHDWYAIEATEGDEITVVYEIVRETDLFDPALVLHTPDDETVPLDRSADGEGVTAAVTGTYHLHVGPDDETTAADFLAKEAYRLRITSSQGDPLSSDADATTESAPDDGCGDDR
ncbi:hypothetical protein [Halalkalicoccus sp. NIPERK01]|uniref:hypothetical protein n=1 Tax=Halalkalicoccus sp. NIPERK01 TaxID=3053469 RepID=UPI00256EE813|nr:hypothetical protein [Halalkalicoccus sp. NIPERK01]MDL5360841.1 hypothetical protein [Halalkalicoccus sp. NIPERK01]